MAIANILSTGIDNYFSYDRKILIATAISLPLGFLLHLISTIDGWWAHSDTTRLGLWRHCFLDTTFTCCNSFSETFGSTPGWLVATLVFMILALITSFLTLTATVITMCVSKVKKIEYMKKVVPILCIVTAILLLISIAVFADNHHTESWTKGNRISRSFVTAALSLLIYLVTGVVLLCFSFTKNRRTGDLSYIMLPPPNWTKYSMERSITAWNTHIDSGHHNVEIVKASSNESDAIEYMIGQTWISNLAGKGLDANGLDQLNYKNMKVVKVERIENPMVFETYAQNRNKLIRRVRKVGKNCEPLENTVTNFNVGGCIKTTFFLNTNVFKDLHPEVNEHYLFHGAPVDKIDDIAEDGIDIRLGLPGLMGKAFYAAETPTKSDHYVDTPSARDKTSDKKMLLVRVLLGEMFVTDQGRNFVRPPCKTCADDKCQNRSHHVGNNWSYDSVVVARRNRHREFVVYDKGMCYPEYIITYRRV